jgi:uncharacterized protein YdhG (YjbR/CyaY superfamily)
MDEVDAYIDSVPKEFRAKLRQMRKIIRKAAPKSVESKSYGMPFYAYNGRLAYFRLGKGYVGLYIPPMPFFEYTDEMKKYMASKSTFQFPLSKKLPVSIISKVVAARKEFNEGTAGHVKSITEKLRNGRGVAR